MTPLLGNLALGTLAVRGPDAVSWLNGLLTQDLGKLTQDCAVPSLFLSKQGKVRASLVVVREANQLTLGVAGLTAEQLGAELDPYLVMEDVEWAVEPGVRWLGGCLTPPARAQLNLSPSTLAARFDSFGSEGSVVVLKHGVELPHGLGIQIATSDELSAFRVDRGIPWFGVDYGETDNPHEASLDKSHISFQKGCYLGQEVVCMQEMRGKVKRRLVRLVAEEAGAELRQGASLASTSGEEVGQVTTTSAARALGRVKAPLDTPGSELLCGSVRCRVLALEPGAEWAQAGLTDRVRA
jgi:tRNA-modifying protein YgfZ